MTVSSGLDLCAAHLLDASWNNAFKTSWFHHEMVDHKRQTQLKWLETFCLDHWCQLDKLQISISGHVLFPFMYKNLAKYLRVNLHYVIKLYQWFSPSSTCCDNSGFEGEQLCNGKQPHKWKGSLWLIYSNYNFTSGDYNLTISDQIWPFFFYTRSVETGKH